MKGQYVHYENAPSNKDGIKYILLTGFTEFSLRYGKTVTCYAMMVSDGATGAADLRNSRGFWVHDRLCDRGTWDDGSPCTNWQASRVLSDILKREGRIFRSKTWLIFTFLLGGKKLRKKNGWIRLKRSR